MRIVIMTAPIGGGHISAADAVATALKSEKTILTISAPVMDTGFNRLPRIYSFLTTRIRFLWAAYYYARKVGILGKLNGAVVRTTLRHHIMSENVQADVVIVMHSIYCHLLSELQQIARLVVVVPTDLFGGPAEWFISGADVYIVASRQMRTRAVEAGIRDAQVIMRRLPTNSAIVPKVTPRTFIPRPRILIVGGAEGVGPIRSVAIGLSEALCEPRVTAICGDNRRLAQSMRSACPQAQILSFVPDLAQSLSDFDLVITKPGSLTLQEAIDAGVPFLLMPGNPGIESANMRTAQHYGLWTIRGRRSARFALNRLFGASGTTLQSWDCLVSSHAALRATLPQRRLALDDLRRIL